MLKSIGLCVIFAALACSGFVGYLYMQQPNHQISRPVGMDQMPIHLQKLYVEAARSMATKLQIPAGTTRLLSGPLNSDPYQSFHYILANEVRRIRGIEVELHSTALQYASKLEKAGWSQQLSNFVFGQSAPVQSEVLLASHISGLVDDEEEASLSINWAQAKMFADSKNVSANKSPTTLAKGHEQMSMEKSYLNFDYVRCRIEQSPILGRSLAWFAVFLLPSIVGLGLTRRVLKEGSNRANLSLVVSLAIPGILAAWILSAMPIGFGGLAIVACSTLFCGFYAYWYCSWVDALRR